MDAALAGQALADMAVDLLAERVARRHDPGFLAGLVRKREPARGDGARDVVGLHLRDVAPELLEGLADLALEARHHGLFQGRITLAHDLVHHRGLHAGGLELGEGLAGVDGVELLGVADQHHAGDADLVRDSEQIAGLHGGSQRALVDHQDGLREGGAHLLRALPRQPSLGHAGVAGEEHLEGFGLDSGFRRQRLHRRGRRREADHPVALLLRQHPGPVEHGGLAAAGVALDADHAVLSRQDQLDGVLLPGRERPLVEVPLDHPAPHRRPPAALARTHGRDGFPFLPDRLRGRQRVLGAGDVHGVQGPGLLQRRDLALGLRHRHLSRRMGQHGGKQIVAGEHGLALREMRHRPGDGFRRGRSPGAFRCGLATRRLHATLAGPFHP